MPVYLKKVDDKIDFVLDDLSQHLRGILLSGASKDALDDQFKEANRWLEKYPNDEGFGGIVKKAISDLLKENRLFNKPISDLSNNQDSDQKPSLSNTFRFGIELAQKIALQANSEGSNIKREFVDFIIDFNNEFRHAKNQLPSGKLQILADDVDKILASFQDHVLNCRWDIGINCLPLDLVKLNFVNEIDNKLRVLAKGIDKTQLFDSTFTGLMNSIEKAVEPAEKLSQQIDNIFNIGAVAPGADPMYFGLGNNQNNMMLGVLTVAKKNSLAHLEALIGQEKIRMEDTLSGIQSGFKVAGMLAESLFPQDRLAGDIVAVGEATVSIAASLATLYAGSAMTGPAMPVVAIAGTVITLASRLFGSKGPSKEEIISKQIQRLSESMHTRFDRIEVMIDRGVSFLAKRIDQGFNALAKNINRGFQQIRKDIYFVAEEILKKFDELGREIKDIQFKLDQMNEEHQKKFDKIIDEMIRLKKQITDNHEELVRILENIATKDYKKLKANLLTASSPSKEELNHFYLEILHVPADLAIRNVNYGQGNFYGFSNAFINQVNKLTHTRISERSLVNPLIWADGVRIFMQVCLKHPNIFKEVCAGKDGGYIEIMSSLRKGGDDFEASMKELQIKQEILKKLIINYKKSLSEVLNFIYKKVAGYNEKIEIKAGSKLRKDEMNALPIINGEEDALAVISVIENMYKYIDFFMAKDDRFDSRSTYDAEQASDGARFNDLINGTYKNLLDYIAPNFRENGVNNAAAAAHRCINHSRRFFYLARRFISIPAYEPEVMALWVIKQTINYQIHTNNIPSIKIIEKYFELLNENKYVPDILKHLNTELKKHDAETLFKNLDTSLNELSTFIAFVFPKQFLQDLQLKAFLDTLLTSESILSYLDTDINTSASKRDFIAIQEMIEPDGEISQLESYLINHVNTVVALGNKVISEYRHPLIEDVLSELKIFGNVMQAALLNQASTVNLTAGSNDQQRPTTPKEFDEILRSFVELKIAVDEEKEKEVKNYKEAKIQRQLVLEQLPLISNFFEEVGCNSNKKIKYEDIKGAVNSGGRYSPSNLK